MGVTKQWFQIAAIWLGVLISSLAVHFLIDGELKFLFYSSIAAASIALVSIEHLVSSSAKNTVRQQVYVSAGSFLILAGVTLLSLAS